MDNALFRVNGPLNIADGFDFLQHTIELAMRQNGFDGKNGMCPKGWSFCPTKGLVFYWMAPTRGVNNSVYQAFSPMPGQTDFKGISIAQTASAIRSWLASSQAAEVKPERWCENTDHDGHNSDGFLLYKEDWGQIGDCDYTIFAVKPASLWHGK